MENVCVYSCFSSSLHPPALLRLLSNFCNDGATLLLLQSIHLQILSPSFLSWDIEIVTEYDYNQSLVSSNYAYAWNVEGTIQHTELGSM